MREQEPTVRSRELGDGLREVMRQAGLHGQQTAHLLALSPSWVSRLLSGKRGCTELDVAAFLSKDHQGSALAVSGPAWHALLCTVTR
ncbi:MAG: helix-turn-helix domain-containing protein [Pseudonocardiaceae bacterium]